MPIATARQKVRKKARRLVKETWEAQANLSFFLAVLVLFAFVFPLTQTVEQHFNVYVDICYALLLMSGTAIGWDEHYLFYVGLVTGLAGLLVRIGSWWYPALVRLRGPCTLLATLALILILLVKVFRKGPVTSTRIQGAIALYLLFGFAWSNAYAVVASHNPAAFNAARVPTTSIAWTYFSFITLTTVGYGDVVPVSPAARVLATGEALCGQIYLTVMIARLVALQVSESVTAGNSKDDPQ